MRFEKVFNVEITEIYHIEVSIQGKNKEDALNKAKEKYKNGEYTIGNQSLVAAEFDIKEDK